MNSLNLNKYLHIWGKKTIFYFVGPDTSLHFWRVFLQIYQYITKFINAAYLSHLNIKILYKWWILPPTLIPTELQSHRNKSLALVSFFQTPYIFKIIPTKMKSSEFSIEHPEFCENLSCRSRVPKNSESRKKKVCIY